MTIPPAAVAHADQLQAARDETVRLMPKMIQPGDEMRRAPTDGPPWLRALIDRFNAAPATGCLHLTSPQPVACAAWWPGRYVCLPCAADGALAPTAEENFRCDCCQQIKPQDVAVNALQGRDAQLFWFGLCSACKPGWVAWTKPVTGEAGPA